ncbi:hypothetical protein N658DRAFT_66198 [Parathielavia hyrcaniae]|uniref:Uncharacterized protein n=1 Tax=Parathielavia hyrcaniae TaxID=113614 RepID=A0AAN6PQB9_9PEZI|nr:hypothetical protein N658DRAFT_66198 [Parathielavia hyrcaniae]
MPTGFLHARSTIWISTILISGSTFKFSRTVSKPTSGAPATDALNSVATLPSRSVLPCSTPGLNTNG